MTENYQKGYSIEQDKKSKSRRNTAILAIGFLLAGLGILGYGGYSIYKGYESLAWPRTSGIINDSYAELQRRRSSGTSGSHDQYVARIRYSYTLDGSKAYSSNEIGYGKSQYTSRIKSKTEKYLQQFPVGKSVTVFYNPENPNQAVLKQGITGGALLMVTIGIFFLLAASAMFYTMRIKTGKTWYQGKPPIEPSSWGRYNKNNKN